VERMVSRQSLDADRCARFHVRPLADQPARDGSAVEQRRNHSGVLARRSTTPGRESEATATPPRPPQHAPEILSFIAAVACLVLVGGPENIRLMRFLTVSRVRLSPVHPLDLQIDVAASRTHNVSRPVPLLQPTAACTRAR